MTEVVYFRSKTSLCLLSGNDHSGGAAVGVRGGFQLRFLVPGTHTHTHPANAILR